MFEFFVAEVQPRLDQIAVVVGFLAIGLVFARIAQLTWHSLQRPPR